VRLEASDPHGMPHPRYQGKVCTVLSRRGRSFEIEFYDGGKRKVLLANPVHLLPAGGPMTEAISLTAVKDLLTEAAQKRTLSREAQLALQHAEASVKLTREDTEKLLGELKELPWVDPLFALKVADLLPQFPEEVRLLASKDRTVLDEEQIKSLLELTAKYR